MYPPKQKICLLYSFQYKEVLLQLCSLESVAMTSIHKYFSRISDAYRIPMKFVLITKSDHCSTHSMFTQWAKKS